MTDPALKALRDALNDLVDACYTEGTSSSWRLCGVCQTEHHVEATLGDQTHDKGCAVDEAEKVLRSVLSSLSAPQEEEIRIEMRVPFSISGRLGIGAAAWAELLDIETRGVAQRNNDHSGMSIGWRTFKTVMNALRHCGEKHYVNPSALSATQTREQDIIEALTVAQRWLANSMPIVELDGPKPLPLIAAVLAALPAPPEDTKETNHES